MNPRLSISNSSKILIIGTSGSGKSTLARKLCLKFGLHDIELDALHWLPNWTETPLPEFRQKITQEISKASGFVIHGNYNKVSDLTWQNAEIIIWLDYPKYLVMFRVIKRSLLRMIQKELLWGTNTESFKLTFFTKRSIILWAWNTYDLRKKQYENLIQNPEYLEKTILKIQSPRELNQILDQIF
jgi:adenylate kinase family enzyme